MSSIICISDVQNTQGKVALLITIKIIEHGHAKSEKQTYMYSVLMRFICMVDFFNKCISGTTLGNVVTFLSSGFLCAYGFDNGWGSIFYVTGNFVL